MRARYVDERSRRERAQFNAYSKGDKEKNNDAPPRADVIRSSDGAEDSDGDNDSDGLEAAATNWRRSDSSEALSSLSVEKLLLGESLIPSTAGQRPPVGAEGGESDAKGEGCKGGNVRPETATVPDDSGPSSSSNRDEFIVFPADAEGLVGGRPALGWNDYRGFGAALERCHRGFDAIVDVTGRGDPSDLAGKDANTDGALEALAPFLDMWDERQRRDAAESELVELFDESVGISSSSLPEGGDLTARDAGMDFRVGVYADADAASRAAADSMSFFIETGEENAQRTAEMKASLLPAQRHGRLAFADRYCWKVSEGSKITLRAASCFGPEVSSQSSVLTVL